MRSVTFSACKEMFCVPSVNQNLKCISLQVRALSIAVPAAACEEPMPMVRREAAACSTYFRFQHPTCSSWWSHSRSGRETLRASWEPRCTPPHPAWLSGSGGTRDEMLSSPGAPRQAHPLSCPGYSASHSGSTGCRPSASQEPVEAQPPGRCSCCLRCSWCSWTGCHCSCWAGRQWLDPVPAWCYCGNSSSGTLSCGKL